MHSDHFTFEVNWQTFFRILFFSLFAFLLYSARQTVGVFLVAFVISIGFEPFVNWLEKKRIPRILGTVLVFLVGLVLLAVTIYLVAPIIVAEAGGFIEHLNNILTSSFGVGLSKKVVQALNFNIDQALNFLITSDISVTGAARTVIEKVVLFLSTIIISFYLMVEKSGVERLIRGILPYSYEKPVLVVFNRFEFKIRRWLTSQLLLGLVMGIVVSVGLWLLGVKYSLVIGLLAFIFELVPMIGPILVGFVAFLVAAADSFSLGIYTLLFFFLVQQLENHILIPLVMGRVLKINPVMVIISLLAGTQFAGFVGLVLAVPAAVLAQEFFNYLAERKGQKPMMGI